MRNKYGSHEWMADQASEPENCPRDKPNQEFLDKVNELWSSIDSVVNDDDYSDFMDLDLKEVLIKLEEFMDKHE